jgi:DNA-binding NarL/FixJ family response regulator
VGHARHTGTVSLPRVHTEPAHDHQPEESPILLVDDDRELVEYLAKWLARFAPVRTAASVSAARRALEVGADWRAIIVDLSLPDGSGLEVIVNAKLAHPVVPMLILTGNPERARINVLYAMDVDYLEKPADLPCLERFLMKRAAFPTKVQITLATWRDRYGLTRAEQDVLRRFALGETREAIAMARGSSLATVRRQISDLLLRTMDDSLAEAATRLLREATSDVGVCSHAHTPNGVLTT